MLLAGDVGGTKTLLGLFDAADPRPTELATHTYVTTDFNNFTDILEAFAAEIGHAISVDAVAIGVAGPVVAGRAALTNITWDISVEEISARLVTKRVRLGTSVLDFPYYNPVMLARRITTLDVLSGGRAVIGLGLGWSPEEFEAAGASMKGRGARANEALQVMKTIWANDPAEFSGKYYQVAKSIVLPKPVQKPHPPIYMAAYAPAAMKRVATQTNGWLPVGIPVEGMRQMWEGIRSMAREAGRNPDDLKLIVRANTAVLPEAQGEGRYIFVGSKHEVKADIKACKELGAHEIEFDPTSGPQGETVQGFIETAELMRELAR